MSLKQLINHHEIWKALTESYIKDRLDDIHKSMDTAKDFDTIKELQGRVKELRDLAQLKQKLQAKKEY